MRLVNESADHPHAAAASSEATLLGPLEAGDFGPLGLLFDAHGAAVRRFIQHSGVPSADVDDLVQQTFLDVPRASRSFDRRSPFRRWLLGIAAIIVARHRRSSGRDMARRAAWARDPSLQSISPDICRELEWKQGAEQALAALERLTPKKRAVFEMLVLADVSGEDAARSLGVPVATVWTRMHHARRDLRRMLESSNRRSRTVTRATSRTAHYRWDVTRPQMVRHA